MKKLKHLILVTIAGTLLLTGRPETNAFAAEQDFDPFSETKDEYDARVQWFRDAKFGVMLCWNPSSLIGQEISFSRAEYGPEKYDQLYKRFKGENFDAKQWIEIFEKAGMRYSVIVPKHFDGFCMWDTKETEYNVMSTPFGRDWVKELAEASKDSQVKFGIYFTIADHYDKAYSANAGADLTEYIKTMKGELEELLTNYGPVGCIWFDYNWDASWTHEYGRDMYGFLRRLQPETLIGNRVDAFPRSDGPYCKQAGSFYDAPDAVGDYQAREWVLGKFYMEKAWDRCLTLNKQGWAWVPPVDPRPLSVLLNRLIQCIARDGNFILGVGPRPDGTIHPEHVRSLLEMGEWLNIYGEAVYGTRGGPYLPSELNTPERTSVYPPLPPISRIVSTRKGNKIFLFIQAWENDVITLPALPAKIESARLLNGGTVSIDTNEKTWDVHVPKIFRTSVATVVELTLDKDAMEFAPVAVPEPVGISVGCPVTVSGEWTGRELSKTHVNDGNFATLWGAPDGARDGWIEIDLGEEREIVKAIVDDSQYKRTRKFEIKAKVGDEWKTVASGTTIGYRKKITFDKVKARIVRLEIQEAIDVPVIAEFQLFE